MNWNLSSGKPEHARTAGYEHTGKTPPPTGLAVRDYLERNGK